eukprot:scaffold10628_cov131-Skeletonema_menzelii.AAC.4
MRETIQQECDVSTVTTVSYKKKAALNTSGRIALLISPKALQLSNYYPTSQQSVLFRVAA